MDQQRATTRRDLLQGATFAGAAAAATAIAGRRIMAQQTATPASTPVAAVSEGGGLLYPQQNALRNLLDLSGLWDFELDPKEEGEASGWSKALSSPRPIARAYSPATAGPRRPPTSSAPGGHDSDRAGCAFSLYSADGRSLSSALRHKISTPSPAAVKEARKIAIFAAAKSAWSGNAAPAMNRDIVKPIPPSAPAPHN